MKKILFLLGYLSFSGIQVYHSSLSDMERFDCFSWVREHSNKIKYDPHLIAKGQQVRLMNEVLDNVLKLGKESVDQLVHRNVTPESFKELCSKQYCLDWAKYYRDCAKISTKFKECHDIRNTRNVYTALKYPETVFNLVGERECAGYFDFKVHSFCEKVNRHAACKLRKFKKYLSEKGYKI